MEKAQLILERKHKSAESVDTEAKISKKKKKIEKAKKIKRKLEHLKADVKDHKYNTTKIFKEYDYWTGQNNSKWIEKSEAELVNKSLSDCINNIDDNIDKLIDKITEMENEVNSLGGTLSSLKNIINSLTSAIEKIMN